MGSCGIGRAPISVAVSAPIPAPLSVHAVSFAAIQLMYCKRQKETTHEMYDHKTTQKNSTNAIVEACAAPSLSRSVFVDEKKVQRTYQAYTRFHIRRNMQYRADSSPARLRRYQRRPADIHHPCKHSDSSPSCLGYYSCPWCCPRCIHS